MFTFAGFFFDLNKKLTSDEHKQDFSLRFQLFQG